MTDSLKFMSFHSGSCGNCYYLGDGRKGIIIDAGVSLRRLKKFLGDRGMTYDSFGTVLITHCHLDHIRHLGSFCKKLLKPVYTTPMIHGALADHTFTRDHIGSCRKMAELGVWTEVLPGVKVRPFEVEHDANQTVGYAVDFEGYRFVIMTDLGRVSDEAIELSRTASTVVIESNYDVDQLMTGPYTPELKKRILEDSGHLSNDDCALALKRIAHDGLKNVFLCHRSHNNNTEKLAYNCSKTALREAGRDDVVLRVLPRDYPSQEFILC